MKHWADGGETNLDNLMLLCRRHHTAVHEEGYRVEFSPDGSARFFHPMGWELDCVPRMPLVTAGREVLSDLVAAAGIEIGRHTGSASTLTVGCDYGWAIQVLHPAARRVGRTLQDVSAETCEWDAEAP